MSHRVVARMSRRVIPAVAVLVGAAAATLVVASPAAAAITSRIIVAATTPTDLEDHKFISVSCPTGTVAVGGDAVIVGGDGIPHLNYSWPTPTSNGWGASATEFPGGASAWRLTAHAICVTGVTGRERALRSFPVPANVHSGTESVSCPTGKKAIGWGGGVSGYGQFILSEVHLSADMTTVTLRWARVISAGNEGVQGGGEVIAICIDPVPGMERVQAVSASDSTASKAVIVNCPYGKKLYGTHGGSVNGGRSVKLESIIAGTGNAVVFAREMVYGTPDSWRVYVTGVCAP